MSKYINGNYFVVLNNSGTKIYRALRHDDPTLKAEFPDSIDLKITNKCSFNCPFCHESSELNGKSFNLQKTIKVLESLPKVGIELAIGGGDIFEDWEKTKQLLNWCNNNGFNCRVTINIKDIDKFGEQKIDELQDLVSALGISIDKDTNILEFNHWSNISLYPITSFVYHFIVGINPVSQIEQMLKGSFIPILILGYKSWGRGKYFNLPDEKIENWKEEFKSMLYRYRRSSRSYQGSLSFDNLAIEQLDIGGSLLKEELDYHYMGDEFTHSMYIDAVEEVFAPTSRDPFRVSWNDMSLIDFFKTYRKEDKNTSFYE